MRVSRPVLRGAEGETPSVYSPCGDFGLIVLHQSDLRSRVVGFNASFWPLRCVCRPVFSHTDQGDEVVSGNESVEYGVLR